MEKLESNLQVVAYFATIMGPPIVVAVIALSLIYLMLR